MTLAVQILIAYLLSHSAPVKAEARQYLKDKLSGWKERVALAVFDAAWDAAMAAVGNKVGSLSKHAGDEFALASVLSDKQSVA
jgi:hypothetical protein